MRSRNSLNGTARNRGSRSARPSSSVIGSAWSLGIWHLDYGGTPPVSGCGRITRHTTRSVLPPFSYHGGSIPATGPAVAPHWSCDADFAVVISQCRFGSVRQIVDSDSFQMARDSQSNSVARQMQPHRPSIKRRRTSNYLEELRRTSRLKV